MKGHVGMRPEIVLVYDRECPNVPAAREALRKALRRSGYPQRWIEWDRNDRCAPELRLGYGSPTILVDGVDVMGEAPSGKAASSCRLYPSDNGLRGAPSVSALVAAIIRAASDPLDSVPRSRG